MKRILFILMSITTLTSTASVPIEDTTKSHIYIDNDINSTIESDDVNDEFVNLILIDNDINSTIESDDVNDEFVNLILIDNPITREPLSLILDDGQFTEVIYEVEETSDYDPEVYYSTVTIRNSIGDNIFKFRFYYDRDYPCWNNIRIDNLTGYKSNFRFNIYLDGNLKYTGIASIFPYESLYFDDAFNKCNSSYSTVYVKTY